MSEITTKDVEDIVVYTALAVGAVAVCTVAGPAVVAVEAAAAAVHPVLGEAAGIAIHHGLKHLPHLL